MSRRPSPHLSRLSRVARHQPPARRAARPARNALVAVAAVLAALALGACGDSHTRVTTGTYAGASGKNAPYLNVGPLIYEVQISRELNPYNSEDADLPDRSHRRRNVP